jgi:1-acyl-sn-glycerol-3-phosphate acyltransferase
LSHGLGDLFFILMTIPLAALLTVLPRYRYRLVRGIVSRYLVLMFQRVLPFLGVYRIDEVAGLDRAQEGAPVVFVANHRGRLDGPLLLSYLQRTGVVVKSRYARHGTLAVLAWVFDFITIDSRSLDSLASMAAEVRRLLERGMNLLIFPEGSRSVSGRLLPFRNAAFRLALEQGRPVVPVIVHSTAPFMSKSLASFFPREPLRYRIRFLPAQRPAPGETAEDLAARVHRLMARELRDLDPGTAWPSWKGSQP